MGKIFVFGDSIAYGKWDELGGWVARLRMHIDKKYNLSESKNIQVYNLGIPGEVSTRLVERAKTELTTRDLEDSNGKNLVIFAIGINDTSPANWLTGKQTNHDTFRKNMISLALSCKNTRNKIIFIGLTPVNEVEIHDFDNKTIKQYDDYITDFCQKTGFFKVDLFEDFISSNFTEILVDGIHPSSEGHEMMFEKILDFLEENKLIEYCI